MGIDGREELLRAYWRELSYLRNMGSAFAETYPKVAGRLELGSDVSPDPHVERLIESFAFLTARIQQNLDSEFPEIATELLNILHPHYLNPIPSMAVATFEVDPRRGKLTSGHVIPRHTPLFTHAAQGESICRFRTCYPVTLWPVDVAEAAFESPAHYPFLDAATDVTSVLRLRIESRAGSLAELGLDRLRFYLNGDRMAIDALYETLFCQCAGVMLLPEGRRARRPVRLTADALQPVGFERDDEVIPYPPLQPAGLPAGAGVLHPAAEVPLRRRRGARAPRLGARVRPPDPAAARPRQLAGGRPRHLRPRRDAGDQPVPAHHRADPARPPPQRVPAGARRPPRALHRDPLDPLGRRLLRPAHPRPRLRAVLLLQPPHGGAGAEGLLACPAGAQPAQGRARLRDAAVAARPRLPAVPSAGRDDLRPYPVHQPGARRAAPQRRARCRPTSPSRSRASSC